MELEKAQSVKNALEDISKLNAWLHEMRSSGGTISIVVNSEDGSLCIQDQPYTLDIQIHIKNYIEACVEAREKYIDSL